MNVRRLAVGLLTLGLLASLSACEDNRVPSDQPRPGTGGSGLFGADAGLVPDVGRRLPPAPLPDGGLPPLTPGRQ